MGKLKRGAKVSRTNQKANRGIVRRHKHVDIKESRRPSKKTSIKSQVQKKKANIKKNQNDTAIMRQRKDINKLNANQKERYFSLLRLIHVIPVQTSQDYIFRVNILAGDSEKYSDVVVKSLFDTLLARYHSTGEYNNIFFAYWNRQFMINFQNILVKADQFLKTTTAADWANSIKKNFKVDNIISTPTLEAIIKNYKGVCQGDNNIAAHYWNFFLDKQNQIQYPKQFFPQKNQSQISRSLKTSLSDHLTLIDGIINKVYSQTKGLNQFNFETRIYNNFQKVSRDDVLNIGSGLLYNQNFVKLPSSLDIDSLLRKNKQFFKDPQPENPQAIVANKFLNANSKDYFNDFAISNTIGENNQYFYKLSYQLNGFDSDYLNFMFGGKDVIYYNNPQDPLRNVKVARNMRIPYYQFARSLLTPGQKYLNCFGTTNPVYQSIQSTHNYIHGLLGCFMTNLNLAIINPLFFPIHSLLDLMLEIKINWEIQKQGLKPNNLSISNSPTYLNVNNIITQPLFPFTTDDDDKLGEEKYPTFLQAWAAYKKNKKQKGQQLLKKDYDIITWIDPNWKTKVQQIGGFDPVKNPDKFQQLFKASGLKYEYLMVNTQVKNQERLRRINEITVNQSGENYYSTYDIKSYSRTSSNDTIIVNMNEVVLSIEETQLVPKIQSPSILVQVQNSQNSQEFKNKFLHLKDSQGNIIETRYIGNLDHSNKSVYQEKYPLNETYVEFRENYSSHEYLKKVKQVLSLQNLFCFEPYAHIESNLYAATGSPETNCRFLTGTKFVKLNLSGNQRKQANIIFTIANNSLNDSKGLTYRPLGNKTFKKVPLSGKGQIKKGSKNQQVIYEAQEGTLITEVVINIGDENYRYVFPLYRLCSEIEINTNRKHIQQKVSYSHGHLLQAGISVYQISLKAKQWRK